VASRKGVLSALCAILAGCGSNPDLLRLVPSNATSIAGIRPAEFRGTALAPILEGALPDKGIDEVVAAMVGGEVVWIHRGSAAGLGGGPSAALRGLLPTIEPGARLWAASVGDHRRYRAPERSNLENLEKILAGLDTLVLWIPAGPGIEVRLVGGAVDEPTARRLHGAMRAGLAMARMSAPDLRPALDSASITQQGTSLRVSARLGEEQLSRLLRLVP
jgi:hypothetical protein